MIPSTRKTFKEYCLRNLGQPALRVNVADEQIEDRIDDAIQYWQTFHADAIIRTYLKHSVTQDNITNGWVPVDSNVLSIIKLFPIRSMQGTNARNLFDANYQIRLEDWLSQLGNFSLIQFSVLQSHMALLDFTLSPQPQIEFSIHTNRLQISNWDSVNVGDYLIMEAFVPISPEEFPKAWNDHILKRYATALIKQQWGSNLKKFGNVPLVGGVVVDGQALYTEASEEIRIIKEEVDSTWNRPPAFMVG